MPCWVTGIWEIFSDLMVLIASKTDFSTINGHYLLTFLALDDIAGGQLLIL